MAHTCSFTLATPAGQRHRVSCTTPNLPTAPGTRCVGSTHAIIQHQCSTSTGQPIVAATAVASRSIARKMSLRGGGRMSPQCISPRVGKTERTWKTRTCGWIGEATGTSLPTATTTKTAGRSMDGADHAHPGLRPWGFSKDGIDWHFNVAEQPYNATITFVNGTRQQFSTFERPHLLFDAQTGRPTHLVNGVSPYWDPAGAAGPCDHCIIKCAQWVGAQLRGVQDEQRHRLHLHPRDQAQ